MKIGTGRRPFLANAAQGRKPAERLARAWLVTDARLGDVLAATAAAPPGTGIILRQYEAADRAALARALARLCRRQRRPFLVAGDPALARAVGADGVHLPERLSHLARALKARHPRWIVSIAAHGRAGLARGRGADLALISPVFPTRSHPGRAVLGALRFAALAGAAGRLGLGAVALGGMDGGRFRRLAGTGAAGFAAIDAFAAPAKSREPARCGRP
ncbi:MAG: thiamine phosphate synthase [Alphaproteobacteria bacterium]|nr:thiamine phosphate synthase [Alphaproteobacteria bacterium]